jgi:hypothetical protein
MVVFGEKGFTTEAQRENLRMQKTEEYSPQSHREHREKYRENLFGNPFFVLFLFSLCPL